MFCTSTNLSLFPNSGQSKIEETFLAAPENSNNNYNDADDGYNDDYYDFYY